MTKTALLHDRLYVDANLVTRDHLEAFTHRYVVRTTEAVGSGRACANCKFWMKPWTEEGTGRQQFCHNLGYTEHDSCSDFTPRMEVQEVEHVLESFKRIGSVYAFARGDLGKIARVFPDFTLLDERSAPPLGYDLKFMSRLRPDQVPVVQRWLDYGYGIIKSPTGSGKSVLLAYLIAHLGLRTLILSHETRHLTTLYDRLNEHTNFRALEAETGDTIVGRFLEGAGDYPITFSTFQAFNSTKGQEALAQMGNSFGLVWVDECFPGSTLVDGQRIDTLRVGTIVSCFDPKHPGTVLQRKVLRVMSKVPSGLVRLHIGEHTLVCTPNHPIWTTEGWLPAARCAGVSVLVDEQALRSLRKSYKKKSSTPEAQTLLQPVHICPTQRTVQNGNVTLPSVSEACCFAGEIRTGHGASRAVLLLSGPQERLLTPPEVGNDGAYQQKVCFGSYEEAQPYVESLYGRENGSRYERSDVPGPWWQRITNATAEDACRSPWLAYGSSYQDAQSSWNPAVTSNLLQGGHRIHATENSYRSRWKDTQVEKVEISRQEEDYCSFSARVDSVEILERGSDGTFGGLCPDGLVYNVEVEDLHTYFAEGIGVSNCHHTSAPSYHSVFSSFNSKYRGGTTATPTRKDQTHYATYNSIGPITSEGGNEMLSCAVSWIQTDISIPHSLFKFTKYGWTRMVNWLGQNSELKEQVLDNIIKDIVAGYKPLVICERLTMVHYLKSLITQMGYNVEVVVGQSDKKKRGKGLESAGGTNFEEVSTKLLDGRLHCVIGTNVLNENIDIRPLDCLHLPFPSANAEMEEQRAGRIRRTLHDRDLAAGHVKKTPVIRVYCFTGHNVAAAAEKTRKVVYAKLGFSEGSAAPEPAKPKSKRRSLTVLDE